MTVRPRHREPTAASSDNGEHSSYVPVVRAVEPFETFYAREFRSVVGLAYALSGSRSSAEDLAQEAFVAAHKKWDQIGGYDKPEAWVRRVVSNLSVSRFRRRTSEMKAISRLAGFRRVQVRRLPKRQAQAVALHYLEDMSINDIAAVLECSPNTVKVHLHKGRQTLADRLDLEGGPK